MAGHARYTAVLDACVLHPMVMCDALMSLAVHRLFAAKWSERIDHEWIRSLEERRPDLRGKLGQRRDAMHEAVPDWEVPAIAIAKLEPCLTLPDPGDTHVLAAAIAGHADCIVTLNRRDFPPEMVEPYGIEIVDPDRFIVNQWDLSQYEAIAALKGMRARWRRPDTTPEDFRSRRPPGNRSAPSRGSRTHLTFGPPVSSDPSVMRTQARLVHQTLPDGASLLFFRRQLAKLASLQLIPNATTTAMLLEMASFDQGTKVLFERISAATGQADRVAHSDAAVFAGELYNLQ